MIVKILGLALVAYACNAQSQPCGCGGPVPIPTLSLGSGVGLSNGHLSGPLNSPGSGPLSTPKLPNNLSGHVTLPAPLQSGHLGPISRPVIAESFAKPTYLPSTLQPLSPRDFTPVAETHVATPVNVIATTVIDNSVANSLANTLQLLVVSNLIQSTLNSGASSFIDDNIFETVSATPVFASSVDVVSPISEIISEIDDCGSSMFEATPNFYGGITEVVSPFNVKPFEPIYGGIPEVITPFSPNVGPFGRSPMYLNGYLPEFNSPLPSLYGLPEFNPLAGSRFNPLYTDIPPLPALPMQVSEVIAPIAPLSLTPNFYNGVTETVNPVTLYTPVAAEILLPSSIPAQLICTLEDISPVVSVNIEPLAFDEFGLGNAFVNSNAF